MEMNQDQLDATLDNVEKASIKGDEVFRRLDELAKELNVDVVCAVHLKEFDQVGTHATQGTSFISQLGLKAALNLKTLN